MSEITDEEIDKFVTDELEKDIDQSDSVDEEQVEQSLGEMGFLWSRVIDKLKKDGVCFDCGKDIDFASQKVHVLEATKVDNGVIAFISICPECKKKIEEKGEKNAKGRKEK